MGSRREGVRKLAGMEGEMKSDVCHKALIHKALMHFGMERQLRKVAEEAMEFATAYIQWADEKQGGDELRIEKAKQQLEDEAADLLFVSAYIPLLFHSKEIEEKIKQIQGNLMARIEAESKSGKTGTETKNREYEAWQN